MAVRLTSSELKRDLSRRERNALLKRQSRERKAARGECCECPQPALPGRRRCAPCTAKLAAAHQRRMAAPDAPARKARRAETNRAHYERESQACRSAAPVAGDAYMHGLAAWMIEQKHWDFFEGRKVGRRRSEW